MRQADLPMHEGVTVFWSLTDRIAGGPWRMLQVNALIDSVFAFAMDK
jgi:hypothetical protein